MNQKPPCPECAKLQQAVNESLNHVADYYIEIQFKLKCPVCNAFFPLNAINPRVKVEKDEKKIIIPKPKLIVRDIKPH